jgi:hypothetical protein
MDARRSSFTSSETYITWKSSFCGKFFLKKTALGLMASLTNGIKNEGPETMKQKSEAWIVESSGNFKKISCNDLHWP